MKLPMILMSVGMCTTALFLAGLVFQKELVLSLTQTLHCSDWCAPLFWYSMLVLAVVTWALMIVYLWMVRKMERPSTRALMWAYVATLIVFIGCIYAFLFGALFAITTVY